MYTDLFDRLALTSPATPFIATEYSQPVSMNGDNAVQFNVVCFVQTATKVDVTVQESNDLQNWKDRTGTGATVSITVVGYTLSASTGAAVAAAYVRLKVVLTGGAAGQVAIVTVGINSSSQ